MSTARKQATRETRRTSRAVHRKATRAAKRASAHTSRTARFENDAIVSHLAIDCGEWAIESFAVRFPRFASITSATLARENP